MRVSKYIVFHTIIRFYTIFFINDPHSKKHDPKILEKILITKKMSVFYLNATKKKSSRSITGVPRYLNFCERKK